MTVSKSAYWQSIVRHLRYSDKMITPPTELFIHPHHFPTSFWQWNDQQPMKKNICTPLSKSDATLISKHDLGHDRYTKSSNSIFVLHKRSLSKQQSTCVPAWCLKYKDMYAKSPFASRNGVKTLMN